MSKIVDEAPYHPGYEDAAMGPTESAAELAIKKRIEDAYLEGFRAGQIFAQMQNSSEGQH